MKTDPFSKIKSHLRTERKITNREFRALLDVPYDHAIILLASLCQLGLLKRKGIASATFYEITDLKVSATAAKQFNLLYDRKLNSSNHTKG
jgi:hypothetical protein